MNSVWTEAIATEFGWCPISGKEVAITVTHQQDNVDAAWPHLRTLRQRSRHIHNKMPAPENVGPIDEAHHIFETITHSLGNTVDTLFDIKVIRVEERSTDGQTVLSLQSRNHLRNEANCHDFLESLKSSPPKSTQKIFLLVEDMSLAMLNFLYGELHVPASTIMSHVQDILGSDINNLMKLFMPSNNKSSHSTAEGTDSESLHLDDMTISDMGEYGFDLLAAKRKIDIHDTSRFTLDWRYMVWRSAESQSIEDSAILARQQALGSTVSTWGRSFHEDVFKLGTRIHRSHQIIFKRPWQGIQLESMEERASWIPIEYHGHAIEIYFFDPIPTVRNFKNQSISPVFERPKTRIEMLQSDDSVVILESTRTVFEAYLRSWSSLCKSTEDLRRICQANLIRRNIVALSDTLTVIEAAIKDIDSKMSKHVNIQERIDDWRSQLSSFRPILSEMAHSAQNVSIYLTYMFREMKSLDQNHLVQNEIAKSLSTVKQFSLFRSSVAGSTDRTFQALMASMSILESQGAIAQASSVGKLTELAFVFIPISFAATFYSMQIEELHPSVIKFFILALCLLLGSYSVRVFLRSRLRSRIVTAAKHPIYNYGVVHRGERIPVTTFVRFHLGEVFGRSNYEAFLYFPGFFLLGVLLVFATAKSTAFKILGTLLSVVAAGALSAMRHINLRRKGYRYFLVSAVLFVISWMIFEAGPLETPIKISISSGFATAACFAAWILIRTSKPKFYRFIVVAMPLLSMPTPTALLWLPWSHRPELEKWQAGLAMIACHLGILAISSLLILSSATALQRKVSRIYMLWVYGIMVGLFLLYGVPMILTWTYRYPATLPRWSQIVITAFSSTLILYALTFCVHRKLWDRINRRSRRHNSPGRLMPGFCNSFIGWFVYCCVSATFPLIIWLGQVEIFDKLGAIAKVAITLGWVLFWFIINITYM